jgi:hypothetical protein
MLIGIFCAVVLPLVYFSKITKGQPVDLTAAH